MAFCVHYSSLFEPSYLLTLALKYFQIMLIHTDVQAGDKEGLLHFLSLDYYILSPIELFMLFTYNFLHMCGCRYISHI